MTLRSTLAMGLTAIALLAAPAVPAQEASQPTLTAEDVTDKQVNAFVLAMVNIEKMRQQYMPKIAAEPSEDGRQKIADEVTRKAIAIVEQIMNITPEEYQQIAILAQEDEALMGRIRTRIDDVIAQGRAKQQQGTDPSGQ